MLTAILLISIANIIICLFYIMMLNMALNALKTTILFEDMKWKEESREWRDEIKDIVSSK